MNIIAWIRYHDTRLVWLIVALAVAAGYGVAVQREEHRIYRLTQTAQDLFNHISLNDGLLRRAARMREREREIRSHLRRIEADRSATLTTAQMLVVLQRTGRSAGVRIDRFSPASPVSDASALSGAKEQDRRLFATSFSIDLRGHFERLVTFIRMLSHQRVLIDIQNARFSVDGTGSQKTAVVAATINGRFYRLSPELLSDGGGR